MLSCGFFVDHFESIFMLSAAQLMPWLTSQVRTEARDIEVLEDVNQSLKTKKQVIEKWLSKPNFEINSLIYDSDKKIATLLDLAILQENEGLASFLVEKKANPAQCVRHDDYSYIARELFFKMTRFFMALDAPDNSHNSHNLLYRAQEVINSGEKNNVYDLCISRMNNDFSLVKDIMILLKMEAIVDEKAIKFFVASCPDLMRFFHENPTHHTNLNEFRSVIVRAIKRFFHDPDRNQHTCITMRNVLCLIGRQTVSIRLAKDISWAIAVITHKNARNQKIFAHPAVLDVLLRLFNLVRIDDDSSILLTKNIVQALSNMTHLPEGKEICNIREVMTILDFAEHNTRDYVAHANIAQTRMNLSLLSAPYRFS